MAWETRRKHSYYYHKARVNGHVKSTYFGKGDLAALAGRNDAFVAQARFEHTAHIQSLREQHAQLVEPLAELETLVSALTCAALLLNGYHRHKRQWRKKHVRKTSASYPATRME